MKVVGEGNAYFCMTMRSIVEAEHFERADNGDSLMQGMSSLSLPHIREMEIAGGQWR